MGDGDARDADRLRTPAATARPWRRRAVARPEIEHVARDHIAVDDMPHRRTGIQRGDARLDRCDLRGARQVGLGEQYPIRHRDLPPRLRLPLELRRAVQRIHRRDDAVQPARVAARPRPASSACATGAGSARPVVSIAMRRNGGSAPASRRCHSVSSVSAMSPRTVQQMQPFFSSTASSIACSISRWSSPTAPNSLTITAVSASDGGLSRRFSTRRLAAAQEAGDDRHRHRVRRTIRCHAIWLPHPLRLQGGAQGRDRTTMPHGTQQFPFDRARHAGRLRQCRRGRQPAGRRRPAHPVDGA